MEPRQEPLGSGGDEQGTHSGPARRTAGLPKDVRQMPPMTPDTPCLALVFCFDWLVLWQKRQLPPRGTQACREESHQHV